MVRISFRWLGAAGLELVAGDFVLLVDPFFTRPGRLAVLLGARVPANDRLAEQYAPRANTLLVTHPHYDHLMDAPGILRRTRATAYGSPNACMLLGWQGIAARQRTVIHAGDRLALGPFSVEVWPAYHRPLPLGRGSGVIQDGEAVRLPVRLPLKLSDYRMDACYCFRIHLAGSSLLVGNPLNVPPGAEPVMAAFLSPHQPAADLAATLRALRPGFVAPIHWDDFTLPLSAPLRPMTITPLPGEPRFPPLRRVDLAGFARLCAAAAPGCTVRPPGLFEQVDL